MSYDLLFKQAINFHETGQFDKAEYIYRQILEAVPNNPDVLNLLGLIAQTKNIHVEAIDLFYKAIKEAPNHPPFHFNLAVSLDRWGKPFEAIDVYLKVIELKPEMVEAYNNIATIYLKLGKQNLAEEMYYKSLNINKNSEALSNLSYLRKDLKSLENVTHEYPDDETAFYFLSLLYQEQGDLNKSLENIKRALKLAPYSEYVLIQNANLYALLGSDEAAEDLYRKAIEVNPFRDDVLVSLADIRFRSKKNDEAEELYKRALDINPKNANAHINYGNLLYHKKELHRALEEYRSAVIIDSNIPEISNNIGIIQRDFKEYEEALGLFFNALSKQPENEEFSINIYETILLMFYDDRTIEAKKIAENWLKSMPDNTFAKHLSSSLNGENLENNSDYAQKLFDNFAKNYEETLKRIEYKVIDYIAGLQKEFSGKILDIGCGTGLLGEKIKNSHNYLVGIDISKEMIKIAQSKSIYDELITVDALSYVKENKTFDYIFALDVLGYIGDVEDILKECQNISLCFSFEILENDEKDYTLSENGRYKHSKKYISKLLEKYGLTDIEKHEIVIRVENSKPVLGMIVFAK